MKFIRVYLFKILIAVCSLGGVIISFFTAQQDGYSIWHKRLLYFTVQSNVWIGLTTLFLLLVLIFAKRSVKTIRTLYFLKFIFSVSITVTAIVFFCLLAPFADESYHIWTLSGFLTHLFAPLFSIIDLFIDGYKLKAKPLIVFASTLPPIAYGTVCAIFTCLNVDFGRGDNYPYIFMNHFSSAGLFGFSSELPFLGSAYWIVFITLITASIGFFYYKLKNKNR